MFEEILKNGKAESSVSQHLENISRDALEKYQNIIRRYVRRRQGVYALYRRKKLYYVGLASNFRSRLARHLKDRHGDSWDRFSVYFTIGDTHLPDRVGPSQLLITAKEHQEKWLFLVLIATFFNPKTCH